MAFKGEFLLTAEVTIVELFIPPSCLCLWGEANSGTSWQSEQRACQCSLQIVTCLLPKLLLLASPPPPLALPGRILKSSCKIGDNCLCECSRTCHLPTMETLIIVLIMAESFHQSPPPIHFLPEQRSEKRHQAHGLAGRDNKDVRRWIPKVLSVAILADQNSTSAQLWREALQEHVQSDDVPSNQYQSPPQTPLLKEHKLKQMIKDWLAYAPLHQFNTELCACGQLNYLQFSSVS